MSADRHLRLVPRLVWLGFVGLFGLGFLGYCLLSPSLTHADKANAPGDGIPGVLIGYNAGGGLYRHSFATDETVPLLRRPAKTLSDSLGASAFDVKTQVLFYVDHRHSEVRSWTKGGQVPETVHKILDSHRVSWLILSPSGERLFFPEQWASGKHRLLAYDRKTKKISVVLNDFVMVNYCPAWIAESHMLVAGRHSLIDDKAVWRLFDVDVSAGKAKLLPKLPRVAFALSPDAKTLALHTEEGLVIYTFPQLTRVRTVPKDGLPRGMILSFCFAGDNHLVFSCDPMNLFPAKTYIVNISTGKSRRLFRGFLQGMYYLPVEPDWIVPEDEAP